MREKSLFDMEIEIKNLKAEIKHLTETLPEGVKNSLLAGDFGDKFSFSGLAVIYRNYQKPSLDSFRNTSEGKQLGQLFGKLERKSFDFQHFLGENKKHQ